MSGATFREKVTTYTTMKAVRAIEYQSSRRSDPGTFEPFRSSASPSHQCNSPASVRRAGRKRLPPGWSASPSRRPTTRSPVTRLAPSACGSARDRAAVARARPGVETSPVRGALHAVLRGVRAGRDSAHAGHVHHADDHRALGDAVARSGGKRANSRQIPPEQRLPMVCSTGDQRLVLRARAPMPAARTSCWRASTSPGTPRAPTGTGCTRSRSSSWVDHHLRRLDESLSMPPGRP